MSSECQLHNYVDIRRRVEELIQDQFPLALFEAMIKQHKRHGFKTSCQCRYCEEKRYISYLPGWGNRGHNKFTPTYWDLKARLKRAEE